MHALPEGRPVQAEKRQSPRTAVSLPGVLETGGRALDCEIVNLSASGAMLQLAEPLGENDWHGVLVIPELGSFRIAVKWSAPGRGSRIGLKFEDPPAAVALKLARVLPPPAEPADSPPAYDA